MEENSVYHQHSSSIHFFHALQCQAGQCRQFLGNKGSCQRGLLPDGSSKSWAERCFNSHMAIACGRGAESSSACERTLKDCCHPVCCFATFVKSIPFFICSVTPKSWLQENTARLENFFFFFRPSSSSQLSLQPQPQL